MKNIYLIGINHKTAPIDIREKFYLNDLEQDLFLTELKNNPAVIEGFILSTCNRIEVYLHTIDGFEPFEAIFNALARIKKIADADSFRKSFYRQSDQTAVEHLFRVASGLDSLVIGETQILGQVKRAIESAQQKGLFSTRFNILTNMALRTGKKAQTETSICAGGTSVSWAAVAKAEEVLGNLTEKEILMIGAGKMTELAVGQIHNKNFKKMYLMNRTEANAKTLADKYGGEVVGLYDIKDVLTKIDLCICSAGAPHYILEKGTLEKVMANRNNRKLVMIDISMPRNIDPEVAKLPNVQLYEIDDLNQVVDSTLKTRTQAITQVEDIITQKLREYQSKLETGQTLTAESV